MDLDLFLTGYRPEIAAGIHAMPASRLLGLRCIGFAEGRSANEMTIRGEHTFDGTVVQGGIVGVLADYAAVSAAVAAAPEGWRGTTTGYTVHNLAPASGERLVALGRVAGRNRSGASSSAEVYAVDGEHWRLAATCLATCRLFQAAQASA